MSGLFPFGGAFVLIILVVLALSAVWIYAIVDAARNGSAGWVIAIVFLHLLGAVLYLAFADRSRTKGFTP